MSFLLFFLCCTQSPKPSQEQSTIPKKVHVSLEPESGGNIEIPFEQFIRIVPEASSLEIENQRKVWSILHLLQSPCSFESGSLLSSLQAKRCDASVRIMRSAIHNVNLPDKELVELLTFPDFWFSQAMQTKEGVVVELWMNEHTPLWDMLDEHLQSLKNANLRICLKESRQEKIVDLPLPIGRKMSDILNENSRNDTITTRCSSELAKEVRSSPTWFVNGFRLRGLQSVHAIQRLINISTQDASTP